MTTELMEQRESWVTRFGELERAIGGREPSWLSRNRKEAMARFRELGFPTPAHEEWKYTNVAPIAKTPFRPANATPPGVKAETLAPFLFGGPGANTLVFVNGRLVRERSVQRPLPMGATCGSLTTALQEFSTIGEAHLGKYAGYERHPFVALNTAFLQDGAFVYIPRGTRLADPLHLLFLSVPGAEPTAAHPRNLILVERDSQATIVESYVGLGAGPYWTNAVTEVVVDENSALEHVKIAREGERSFHIATLEYMLGRNARVHSLNFALGGAIVRNDVNAVLDDEGAEVNLDGLYLATGDELVDHHTLIDHAKPHCTSREVYKGILAGRSRGVFNGKVYVRPDAQKTDGKQTNKNLLLSPDALVNTKPQLEIFANDVKCTHGATIGQLDEESIFYLRSRGIAAGQARDILTHAFAGEILDRVKIEALRAQLDRAIFSRLPQG